MRRLVVVGCLAAIAAAAVSLGVAAQVAGPGLRQAVRGAQVQIEPTLVIIGDSLSEGNRVEYAARMGGRLKNVDARSGRTMVVPVFADTAVGHVAEAARSRPGWIVIELGTNDNYLTQDQARVHAEQLLAEAGDTCVLWVLPTADFGSMHDGLIRVSAGISEALVDVPCYRTIRPTDLAKEADGVHLAAAGKLGLAAAIDDATLTRGITP